MNFWQIQSIPTPNIYESRTAEAVRRDFANATFALLSVESVLPFERILTPPEAGAGLYSLVSCEVAGPLARSVDEDSNAALLLNSCVVTVPLSRNVDEDSNGAFALVSVLQVAPVTRTINDETPVTAAFALNSCNVT